MTQPLSAQPELRPDMIVCEGVDKWYGDFQALKGVSATIAEQEVVVVLGPSGSGKSTWIRCIGIRPQTSRVTRWPSFWPVDAAVG